MNSEIYTINKPLKTSPFDYSISRDGSKVEDHYYYENEMNKYKDLIHFSEIKLNFVVESPDNLVNSKKKVGEKLNKSDLQETDLAASLNLLDDPMNFANKNSFLLADEDDDGNIFWLNLRIIDKL